MKTIFTSFALVIALSGCTSSTTETAETAADSTIVVIDTTKCANDSTAVKTVVDTTAKK